MLERVRPADDRTPVAALESVSLVTEARHQLGVDVCDLFRSKSRLAWLVREAVARHRRSHNMKRVFRSPTVSCRVGQGPDDLGELGDGARPAMRNDERERVLFG